MRERDLGGILAVSWRAMTRTLFSSFSLANYLKLALVLFLADLASGGCQGPMDLSGLTAEGGSAPAGAPPWASGLEEWMTANPVLAGAVVLVLLLVLLLIGLALLYISVRARIIFLRSAVQERVSVAEFASGDADAAGRYFLLQVIFFLVGGALLVLLLVPAFLVISSSGLLEMNPITAATMPPEEVLGMIGAFFLAFLPAIIFVAIVIPFMQFLMDDLLLTEMVLGGRGVGASLRALMDRTRSMPMRFFSYIVVRGGLGIGVTIVMSLVLLVLLLVLMVPVGGIIMAVSPGPGALIAVSLALWPVEILLLFIAVAILLPLRLFLRRMAPEFLHPGTASTETFEERCPRCTAPVLSDDRFCGACGALLKGTGA